uniref:Uncharacterized protein n=1 Tax=Plectus sambesii TaxID=2011161 RepID=A0A914X1A9_9BILA
MPVRVQGARMARNVRQQKKLQKKDESKRDEGDEKKKGEKAKSPDMSKPRGSIGDRGADQRRPSSTPDQRRPSSTADQRRRSSTADALLQVAAKSSPAKSKPDPKQMAWMRKRMVQDDTVVDQTAVELQRMRAAHMELLASNFNLASTTVVSRAAKKEGWGTRQTSEDRESGSIGIGKKKPHFRTTEEWKKKKARIIRKIRTMGRMNLAFLLARMPQPSLLLLRRKLHAPCVIPGPSAAAWQISGAARKVELRWWRRALAAPSSPASTAFTRCFVPAKR